MLRIKQSKQPLCSYKPMLTISNSPPSIPITPPAPAATPLTFAASTPSVYASASAPIPKAPLPPLHPYASLSDRYHTPAQHNFATPKKHSEDGYCPIAPIFDIEKSNHIFSHIIKTFIMLSVEELYSIVPDV